MWEGDLRLSRATEVQVFAAAHWVAHDRQKETAQRAASGPRRGGQRAPARAGGAAAPLHTVRSVRTTHSARVRAGSNGPAHAGACAGLP